MSTTTAATAAPPADDPSHPPVSRRTGWATAQISSANSSTRQASNSHFCSCRRAAVRCTLSFTNRSVGNITTGDFCR